MQKKQVGVWVRVSPNPRESESHIHHEIRAKEFVKSRGWNIKCVYRLPDTSGKSVMDCEETKRMIADVRSGTIVGLVFAKIARLARNTRELIEIAEIFQGHGADLISMDMSIDTSTPIGRHFFRTMSSMAEWEREMIVDRISTSALTRAKLGEHVGGMPPYGYRYENKKLVINEEEAPLRRLIFELFLEHKRRKTITRIINERGYRNRRGKPFCSSTIKFLLTDPVAKGLHVMNKRKSGSNKLKPKDEWVFHKVPAIVSEEVWEKANRIIREQAKRYQQPLNTKVHLFTRYLFCHCGAKMTARGIKPNYLCANRCGNKIRKDDIEEIFKNELYEYTVSKEQVAVYFSELEKTVLNKKKEIEALKHEEDVLNKRIEKLLLLHAKDKIETKAFDSYHQKPYEQLQQVRESINELEDEVTLGLGGKKSADYILEMARDLYARWDTLLHEQKREVIETITDRIVVGTDEITIDLYKILPDSHHPTLSELGTNGDSTTK